MLWKKILTAFFFLAYSLIGIAQSKDEKAVSAAVDSFKAALISSHIPSLEKWTDEKLSYGHSGGLVQDKAAFLDNFKTGKSDFVTINLTDQTITVFGKTAIVRHKLNATTNDNNTPGTANIFVLLVWQKNGKQWRLIARQAVKPAV
jgi:ketosteroid isomerase-like protein